MAWFVVRYYADKYQPGCSNKFYVEQGDIIKFGRVRFKIRKLVMQEEDEIGSNESGYINHLRDDITRDEQHGENHHGGVLP